MGDDKKKGGSKGGLVKKLLLLVIVALVGAEVASRATGRAEWSPWTRAQQLVKGQR